jgi:hypothetical protein
MPTSDFDSIAEQPERAIIKTKALAIRLVFFTYFSLEGKLEKVR